MAAKEAASKRQAAREEPPTSAYRILIVDDHPVVRLGLRTLIESQRGLEVCSEADTGPQALELVKRLKPNLVVLDLTLPEMDGLEATRHIREMSPETDVLILTMHFADELAREALRMGARGYVLKSDADPDLIHAVHRIRLGGAFYTAQLAESMAERFKNDPEAEKGGIPGIPLTRRELEILQMLANGKNNKEIAAKLSVSIRTVESHRTHIMHKMNFSNLSDLVRFAIKTHLVAL